MNPDGNLQELQELWKEIDLLKIKLGFRDRRIDFWQNLASDLYDHLIGFYTPQMELELPDESSLKAVIHRFEDEVRYGPE